MQQIPPTNAHKTRVAKEQGRSHAWRLLIAGASVRAAVQSACRWGELPVVAADLFVDEDLVRQAAAFPLQEDYADLPDLPATQFPATHWCYTGGLENHPQVVERVPAMLWGNDAATLRAVRDPVQVAAVLLSTGIAVPLLAMDPRHVPTDGTWLRKPVASAGGNRICVWDESTVAALPESEMSAHEVPYYWQQRIAGTSCGAAFVAANGQARLLGVTHSLPPNVLSVETPFRYGGSVGPIALSDSLWSQWTAMGHRLASAFHLQGLFGVDAIEQQGKLWPIEVNPRYTASLEVLERVSDWNAMQLHVEACRDGRLPDAPALASQGVASKLGSASPTVGTRLVAKQILYAPLPAVATAVFVDWAFQQNVGDWPTLADIPQVGTSFAPGMPVLTLFAEVLWDVEPSQVKQPTAATADATADAAVDPAADALHRVRQQLDLRAQKVMERLTRVPPAALGQSAGT